MRAHISWLDLKIGGRRAFKQPGLSLIGVFGMAVAMTIGVVSFEIVANLLDSVLPVDEGDRIVSVGYWDSERNLPERHLLHDYAEWQEQMTTMETLAAFRDVDRNVALADGPGASARGALITSSAFRALRTEAQLGRALQPSDDDPGAPGVIVLGHQIWQSRFTGDQAILGQTVRVDGVPYTVVGVMPDGFAFPTSHQFWVPLSVRREDFERGVGPSLYVFGRLRPGATIEAARAELARLTERTAAEHPEIYRNVRPRLVPYTLDLFDLENPGRAWAIRFSQILVSLLLIIVCLNVAVLNYARTLARQGEIALRNALGASRFRIVGQLVAEALLISTTAAFVGLFVSQIVLDRIQTLVATIDAIPYWIDLDLSPMTVVYAFGLATLAALITGASPALKATGKRLHSNLRELGGGGTARLGRTWSALIIVQVAMAAAILPLAVLIAWELKPGTADPGFAADEILTLRVSMGAAAESEDGAEPDSVLERARLEQTQLEVIRRLGQEPGVAAVSFSNRVPGITYRGRVELDGESAPEAVADPDAYYVRVGPDFFSTYGAEIVAGRRFGSQDLEPGATPVVVNRSFAQKFAGGANALGRRLRYTGRNPVLPEPAETWYQIVGIVEDFPAASIYGFGSPTATVYHPVDVGELNPAFFSARARGVAPGSLISATRSVLTRIDPTLRIEDISPLPQVYENERSGIVMMGWAFSLMTLSVLLLSAAGVYAMMSFAVGQRTREIGIRTALGAPARKILLSVFSRTLRQLGIGASVGLFFGSLLVLLSGLDREQAILVLFTTPAVLLLTGLAAAVGPARRGLKLHPREALHAE